MIDWVYSMQNFIKKKEIVIYKYGTYGSSAHHVLSFAKDFRVSLLANYGMEIE